MELQCPGCQKRLSIADQFAGQLVKCPLCTATFAAPALPPKSPSPAQVAPPTPPVAPPPAPPAPPTAPAPPPIPFVSEPTPPPPILSAPPPAPPAPPAPPEPEPMSQEPVTTRDFPNTTTCRLRPDILRWVAPACVTSLFLLAFFPWVSAAGFAIGAGGQLPIAFSSKNLWELAFGDSSSAIYTIYAVLAIFLMLPLAWVKLAFEKGWVPIPEVLMRFWPWRSAVVGGLLLLAFLFPFAHYFLWNFVEAFNPMVLGMKLALRVHLVAILACALEFWIERRKREHLPLPEITARW